MGRTEDDDVTYSKSHIKKSTFSLCGIVFDYAAFFVCPYDEADNHLTFGTFNAVFQLLFMFFRLFMVGFSICRKFRKGLELRE